MFEAKKDIDERRFYRIDSEPGSALVNDKFRHNDISQQLSHRKSIKQPTKVV